MFGWSPNGETNFERNAAKMNGFDFPIRNWIGFSWSFTIRTSQLYLLS